MLPTLVLLHGAGESADSWNALIPHLAGLPVLAADLPGRRTTAGPPLATVAEMAAFVSDTLIPADFGPVVVMGHSMGAAVALELALGSGLLARGQLVGVILVAAGARMRVRAEILAMVEAGGVEAAEGGCPATTTLRDWQAVNRFDHLHDLHRVGIPTRIVVGSEDTLTPPKYAAWLGAGIRGAQVEVIEGAGHMLPVESPERLATIVRACLDAWPQGGEDGF